MMASLLPPLLQWTKQGLYCELGDFYIDPSAGVRNAVVTHAHSDHARRGSENYFVTEPSVGLMRCRLGKSIRIQALQYGETVRFGPIEVSLHSAGHILGSAQVRVSDGTEVWLASGDYKREADLSCAPFEVVRADVFITEATFGTPKYRWPKNQRHGESIVQWAQNCAERDLNAVLFGYSLGKAQRILAEVFRYRTEPVLIHQTIVEPTRCYREAGISLAPTQCLDELSGDEKIYRRLILAPPSILRSEFVKRLGPYETAFASGWMQSSALGDRAQWGARYNRGFVLSDHADWDDLNQTILETGAKRIFVQHRNGALVRHLRSQGLMAFSVEALAGESPSPKDDLLLKNLEFVF